MAEDRSDKLIIPQGFCRVVVPSPLGDIIEYGTPELLSDHATRFMMEHMAVPRSARVAEVGCGTGVLSIYAALAGADRVTGTDIDNTALTAARLNGHVNGTPQVQFVKGSLLDPVSGPLDMVLALLPHKPAPQHFNHRYYGGEDGTDLLLPAITQAAERLTKDGVLLLYLNSIAHEARVMGLLARFFCVSLIAEKKRYFTCEEFDGLVPGMFEHLEGLKTKGVSSFSEDEEGLFFMARIYEGRRL
jgi:SAM-dependent methyltransferase